MELIQLSYKRISRRSGIQEIFACEIQILGFGMQNSAEEFAIPLLNGIWNPSSTVTQGIQNPLPVIRNPQYGIHDQNSRLS